MRIKDISGDGNTMHMMTGVEGVDMLGALLASRESGVWPVMGSKYLHTIARRSSGAVATMATNTPDLASILPSAAARELKFSPLI